MANFSSMAYRMASIEDGSLCKACARSTSICRACRSAAEDRAKARRAERRAVIAAKEGRV